MPKTRHPRTQSAPTAILSHVDPTGAARMVGVGHKPITPRVAVAEAFVSISPALARAIAANTLKKGNLLDVARLAGIMAAKRTDQLIPLCHTLPLDHADVEVTLDHTDPASPRVHVRSTASATARTGVEMEALTAAAVAALTVIDMGKAIDRAMVVTGLRVLEKRGGQRGDYHAKPR
jgi:cyclic pyranopterin phosphate synthase